jgi:hypothetical protein
VKKPPKATLIARICILVVLLWNLQCAAAFLFWPGAYAAGFELQGEAGAAAVQGMGLLFVMWNIPYAVAGSDPIRRRISLYEAITMQALGFFGEGALLLLLPNGHEALRATVGRFLWFDGAGLLLLAAAVLLVTREGSRLETSQADQAS